MSATFTAQDVAREAIRLAANNPDAVYVSPDDLGCYYTQGEAGGKPGCLFGQALTNLGVENLARFDRPDGGMDTGIDGVLRKLGIPASLDEDACLRTAQLRQDEGLPWSVAVELLTEMVQEVAK